MKPTAFLTLLLLLAAAARAQDAPKPDAAKDDAAIEALLRAIESVQANPDALAKAREALQKKADEARKAADAAGADSAKAAADLAEKTKQLDALKAEIEKLAKEAEAAKAKPADAQQKPPDPAAQEKLAALERSLAILKALAEPPAGAKPAEAPKPADPAKPEPKPEEKPKPADAPKPAEPAKPEEKKAEAPAADPKIAPEAAEFFEKKIRPILADNCFSCHGPQKQKGELRLDSLAAATKGGASGPAVVPGDLEKSLLIKAINYGEDLQMPPKQKLPQEAIDALTQWVKMGAPWPGDPQASPAKDGKVAAAEAIAELAKTHWAFQPVAKPPLPEPADKSWAANEVDAFILAKLEQNAMKPSPRADKRTLIRRASYDLIGLAPTPDEVAAFESDDSPGAFAAVVDRLLASPQYGERWGRYWLDVARYADTKGYVFQEERRYPYAHTYRDYVIRAFNEDLPYDKFVIEQLAADQISGDDKRPLAAMGFLTLGRRFLNNKNDIIDDRIDVVSRGLMGLTVACARCHDHKYDPVPAKDYYSLYGVFASSIEPGELPLIEKPNEDDPKYQEYKKEFDRLSAEVARYRLAKHQEFLALYRSQAADSLLAVHDAKRTKSEDEFQALARDRKLQHLVVRRWQPWLEETKKDANAMRPVFSAWNAFSAIGDEGFAEKAKEIAAQAAAGKIAEAPVNPLVAKAFAGDAPTTMSQVADRYRALFADADRAWGDALKSHSQILAIAGQEASDPPKALPDGNQEQIRQALYAPDAPANVPSAIVEQLMTLEEQAQLRNRRLAVDGHAAGHPGRPPRAHVMNDLDKPVPGRVFLRGNPANRGDEVPRQFLEVLSRDGRKPFEKGSGRLELAQAIASPHNPLTSRVMVNRVWQYHFGKGLVATPGDFGARGEQPSHPELLDYLAARFVEEGWSVKKLHRLMMLSSAYQQSSADNTDYREKDHDNRLLWRANRGRLDFEATRDTLLQVAGQLDPTPGGPSDDITVGNGGRRRSVYSFIERQNLPGIFRTFDFASPDTTSARRFQTTVPQQALYEMNSPFVVDQARAFAARAQAKETDTPAERIIRLYNLAYQRAPGAEEVETGLKYLANATTETAVSAWINGWGEYDAESKTVKNFKPLPHFNGDGWAGGPKIPDPELGWVSIFPRGGHPGVDHKHSVIRRWISPVDGVVSVSGTLSHMDANGDGVGGHVISERHGEVGAWVAERGQAETKVDRIEVAQGDAIDFLVECRTEQTSDSFGWAPVVRLVEQQETSGGAGAIGTEWSAQSDFTGPLPQPLSPFEKYAQAILMSNELAFVD